MHGKFRILLLLLSSLSLVLLTDVGEAQNLPDNLHGAVIYIRDVIPAEFIQLSTTSRQSYEVPLDKCTSLSPNGVYLAQSSPQRDDLVIRRFDTQELVVQVPWSTEWESCFLLWHSGNILMIRKQGTTQDLFFFEIVGNTLVPYVYEPTPVEYPPLPDFYLDIRNDFIFPAPNGSLYLYERCSGGNILGSGENQFCDPESTELVVYDTQNQTTLQILDNPSPAITGLENRLALHLPADACGSTAWSTTARYLAFEQSSTGPQLFGLRIYDFDTSQYLNTSFANYELDSCKGFLWSPQGNKVAIWVVGRLTEPEPNDDPITLRSLIFFDADTGIYTVTDQPYDTGFGEHIEQMWSPDGKEFIFVDQNGLLVHVDVNSGVTSSLDDNVDRLVTWIPGEEVTPSPTFTPTPLPAGKLAFGMETSANNFRPQIFTINLDGTGLSQIPSSPEYAYAYDPVWSPDGTRIAFTGKPDETSPSQIYVVNADGSNLVPITSGSAANYDPDWSPDGTLLVFTSERNGNQEIYMAQADGSSLTNPNRLTSHAAQDYQPTWSANHQIAFVSTRGATSIPEIFTMNVQGGNVVNITNTADPDSHPVWSPDGSQIAFYTTVNGVSTMYTANADGSNRTARVEGKDAPFDWSPTGEQFALISPQNYVNLFDPVTTYNIAIFADENIKHGVSWSFGQGSVALPSPTPTFTPTYTPSDTPTLTFTPSETFTPTNTFSPTPVAPCDVNVGTGDVNGLITAITNANNSPNPYVICLAANSTYTLTAVDSGSTSGEAGLPTVTGDIHIRGNNATIERSQSASNFRLLEVADTGTLHLYNLTLRYGSAVNGGAIRNDGNLTLTESAVINNWAGEFGGGIYNNGTLTVTGSDLSYNGAGVTSGAILNNFGANATIINSRFRSNSAWRGGGITNWNTLSVEQSVFIDNVGGEGGAIQNFAPAEIHNSCFVGNGTGETPYAVGSVTLGVTNATNNWWGAADGPSGNAPGSGDGILNDVFYLPFLNSAPSHCNVVVTPTPTITPTPSYTPTSTFTPTQVAACTVTVPAGDVAGLVSAMQDANLAPDMDVICLTQSTYTLTAAAEPGVSTDTGLPIVTTPILIRGNNAIIERSQSASDFRLLEVTNAGELHLFNVTLRYGNMAFGGAIRNDGILSITQSALISNSTWDAGGGIYNTGSMEINSSDVSDNNASYAGAGIWNSGTLTVMDSRIRANQGAWGAGILNEGNLTVDRSIFTANNALISSGGAVLSYGNGNMRVNDSCVYGNQSSPFGMNGIVAYYLNGTANATHNWWGAADGPSGEGPGSGDQVEGNLDYSNWLTSAPAYCTVVVTPTPSLTLTPSNTPTNTRTPSPTPTPLPDPIFADNFDGGNLSVWTSSNHDGGDLSASAAAALFGSHGMQAVIDDNNAIYVTDDTPNAESRYRMRFYFDPNSITMVNNENHVIFQGYTQNGTAVVRVQFRRNSGNYQILAQLRNNSSTWSPSSGGWVTISDAVHFIEIDWKAATAAGANNGYLTLWIDGVQRSNTTGINNNTRRIESVRLGAVAGIDSGTRGTYYFDEFESRRFTPIGPE